ncbi:MAG: OadG family protein [Prevotella sp.]|nr:OadG family protein [Prevotella sp.]
MNKFGLLLSGLLLSATSVMFGQGAKNIKINEVMTNNAASLQDEFGQHLPWIELANTSYTTYNVRGMFVTTNRKVLDKTLKAPERIAMMSPIPNGEKRTSMSGQDHLVLFLNSNPAKGGLHLRTDVKAGEAVWVALYDANGVDLLDSVSVPALDADKSFARTKDGNAQWDVKPAEAVTPGIGNYIEVNESKIARLKRDDPYGLGITVLSMGIVFFCLTLLYVFFTIFGKIVTHRKAIKKAAGIQPIKAAVEAEEKLHEAAHKTKVILKDGLETGGIDKEVYMAVIALALKQYTDNIHDEESGIITIRRRHTMWNNEVN